MALALRADHFRNGRVEDGRGSLGPMANAPFPIPAHQTERADFRHSAFRLASPKGTRRVTDRTRHCAVSVSPSPLDTAVSDSACLLMVFSGSSPITTTSPSSKAHQKSGPFAPPALPGLKRSYDPVRLPTWPPPVATLRPLPSPVTGLPL